MSIAGLQTEAPVSLATAPAKLLSVEDLVVEFGTSAGRLRAVDGLNIEVAAGETLALVGESGSGKSVSMLAVMRLLPARITSIPRGKILFEGQDLLTLKPVEMERLRGRKISMIFQEPMTSLNPTLTIGFQIMEPLIAHLGMDQKAARVRALELMDMVGVPDAARRLEQYPHQFSGGMRQRAMIAISLACNPKLLIADEPTTALDVTIQAEILELMKDLTRRLGIALIIITHNLGVVARYADRVAVMYAANLIENGDAATVFSRPRHPYTMGLLRSVPRLDRPRHRRLETINGLPPNLAFPPSGCRFRPRCPHSIAICERVPPLVPTDTGSLSGCFRAGELTALAAAPRAAPEAGAPDADSTAKPLLKIANLTKHFHVGSTLGGSRAVVRAVDDVSFDIRRGETLGLVGESGCGKTTVGRLLLRLETETSGHISFDGETLPRPGSARMKAMRRQIQVIFQDPYSSLNPRMTVGEIISEPLSVYRLAAGRAEREHRMLNLLDQVGLRAEMSRRYPHQLSGGQRQRVGIARALAMEPSFIVCDEAVSALDVSIQGQIINLLDDLQRKLGLTYLFIAHDLAVVRHLSNRVAVMYLGHVMEIADRDTLYDHPAHPYTRFLMSAAPIPDPEVEKARQPRLVRGDLPSPVDPPPGCVFHTRCPMAGPECRITVPPMVEVRPGQHAACIKL